MSRDPTSCRSFDGAGVNCEPFFEAVDVQHIGHQAYAYEMQKRAAVQCDDMRMRDIQQQGCQLVHMCLYRQGQSQACRQPVP